MFIPGYDEALLEERRRRNRSEFQIPDTVAGVELRPLTLNDIAILQEAGVSFFDESPEAHGPTLSLVIMLWWQWVSRPVKASDRLRRRFARAVGMVRSEEAEKDVKNWIRWQFADSPATPSQVKNPQAPITSFAASVCDSVASRCHWSRSEIMNMPLPILWQHIKIANAEGNPSAPRFNPSDEVKSKFLQELAKK